MAGAHHRSWTVLPWLLLGLLSVLPYLNALDCGFVFDDQGQILENPYVAADTPWWQSLTRPLWPPPHQAGLYRPVTALLNRLQRSASAAAFHGMNILLHAAVVGLAYAVLRRQAHLTGIAPLAVAALFAVHPLHTEAVTGIVGRAELLAACFAMLGYFIWLGPAAHGTWRRMLLIAACFALAAGAKESAAGWVLLLAAHRLGFLGDGRAYRGSAPDRLRRAVGMDGAVLAGLAVYALARTAVLGSLIGLSTVGFVENPLFGAAIDARMLTACAVVVRGIGLMLWPATLCADYSYDAIAIETSWASFAGLGALLLLAATLWLLRHGRRHPAPAWALAFYGSLLLPVANLLLPIGTILGERLLYLPSLGILALIVWAARRLAPGRVGGRLALLLLVLAIGALTWRTTVRNRDWRDNQTLFGAAVEAQPRSVKSRANLAAALVRSGDLAAAEKHYREARRIAPSYHAALSGLGHTLILTQRYDEAEEVLESALRFNPRQGEGYYRLGNLLLEVDRPAEALPVFEELLVLNATSQEGWIGKASALFMLENYAASADAWKQAYELAGRPPELERHLTAALQRAARESLEAVEDDQGPPEGD